jgi:glycosyltransferase involved in cell wall biosynthesis
MISFSVAITTYNRAEHLEKLLAQIRQCSPRPEQILVVDSSDELNTSVSNSNDVDYIRSSHKNQPYQRYLAYLRCQSDVMVFLDDDLQIIDFTVFEVMLSRLTQPHIRGVSVGFHHHHVISSIVESHVNATSLLFKCVNFISGVPKLKPGKIYMAGLAGPRPQEETQVDYFNGAIMAFYRDDIGNLFDPVLFSLFERKLGMGEDKIISMAIGLKKKLWFVPRHFFVHPPLTSNYFQDVKSFHRKVIYSRLYISLQYGKHKQYPEWLIYLHYYYYATWRLLLAAFNAIAKARKQQRLIFKGILQGVLLTFSTPFDAHKITPEIDWQGDARRDAGSAE